MKPQKLLLFVFCFSNTNQVFACSDIFLDQAISLEDKEALQTMKIQIANTDRVLKDYETRLADPEKLKLRLAQIDQEMDDISTWLLYNDYQIRHGNNELLETEAKEKEAKEKALNAERHTASQLIENSDLASIRDEKAQIEQARDQLVTEYKSLCGAHSKISQIEGKLKAKHHSANAATTASNPKSQGASARSEVISSPEKSLEFLEKNDVALAELSLTCSREGSPLIKSDYILSKLTKLDENSGLLLTVDKKSDALLAFAVTTHSDKKFEGSVFRESHVDLICTKENTKGEGRKLLEKIESGEAPGDAPPELLTLDAIPSAMPAYQHMGFQETGPMNPQNNLTPHAKLSLLGEKKLDEQLAVKSGKSLNQLTKKEKEEARARFYQELKKH